MTITPPHGIFVNLLIHKTLELYKNLRFYTRKFPKMDRFSLGVRLENRAVEFLELIILAQRKTGPSKILILEKADTILKIIQLLSRVAYELKIGEQKRYILISEQTIEIGKILGGSIKKAKERN